MTTYNSAATTAGATATAAQYNNLRLDVLDALGINFSGGTYNADGLLTSFTNNGKAYTLTYNSDNNVATLSGDGDVFTFNYNSDGALTSIS